MKLGEILNMIAMKYAHSYAHKEIVTMINDVQRRIFRTLYKLEVIKAMDLVAGKPLYVIDFPPDNIISVIVNGREYPYQHIKYESSGCYYYITNDNLLGIYPTPNKSVTNGLTVFHYKVPKVLDEYDLDKEPDLDSAWHELIVYHVCRKLAENARDNEMTAAFTLSIDELENEFGRSKRAKPHPIKDVYGIRGTWQ